MTIEDKEKLYIKANELYDNQYYSQSFNIFFELSNSNHMESQNKVAYMYYNGIGTKKSLDKANYWWEKSAFEGCSDSQFQIGFSQIESKNIESGIKWIEKSASNNHVEAIYTLACYYYHGDYVEQNRIRSIELFEIASKAGHSKASTALVQAINKTYGKFTAIKKLLQIFFTRKLNKEKNLRSSRVN